MGLDMYLYKEIYVGGEYESNDVTGGVDIKAGNDTIRLDAKEVSSIRCRVAYWRKANQIHQWFVNNVQDGNDNCAEYYVSVESLRQLLDEVNEVLENKDKAEELLPPQSGFFFGSNDIDEYYFEDLERTKELLTKILADPEVGKYSFYYTSSW